MKITLTDVLSILGGLGSLIAIIVALRGIKKDREEAFKEAKKDAAARTEANLIQRQVLEEQKKLTKAFEKHLECYSDLRAEVKLIGGRAEEAHRRIDRLEDNSN